MELRLYPKRVSFHTLTSPLYPHIKLLCLLKGKLIFKIICLDLIAARPNLKIYFSSYYPWNKPNMAEGGGCHVLFTHLLSCVEALQHSHTNKPNSFNKCNVSAIMHDHSNKTITAPIAKLCVWTVASKNYFTETRPKVPVLAKSRSAECRNHRKAIEVAPISPKIVICGFFSCAESIFVIRIVLW